MKTLATTERTRIGNRMFAALPRADCERLSRHVDWVTLTFGEVIMEPGEPIRHVYFPNDALVSLLTMVDASHFLEVGMVGKEGMVGAVLGLGANTAAARALVQGSGGALRMQAAIFRREMRECASLRRGVHSYIHALLMQVAQTAACNRYHAVEARMARWLLMTRDRVGSDRFPLTQEFLAFMLGVRRAGVTVAAQGLKRRKLVLYSRGHMSILDGPGLELASCTCYTPIHAVDSRQLLSGCMPRTGRAHP